MKLQKRFVILDEPEFAVKFIALLAAQGMTVASWFRQTARKYYREHKDEI